MPELISVGDMVAMPSAYECQALIYLEAMACARPLIASDIVAAREVVEHRVNGLLHAEGDEDALAQCILALANDAQLVNRVTERGLDRRRARAARDRRRLRAGARRAGYGVNPSSP